MCIVWAAFTKWAKMNLDVERTINVPNLGNFLYKMPKTVSDEQEKERCVLFYPNDSFL